MLGNTIVIIYAHPSDAQASANATSTIGAAQPLSPKPGAVSGAKRAPWSLHPFCMWVCRRGSWRSITRDLPKSTTEGLSQGVAETLEGKDESWDRQHHGRGMMCPRNLAFRCEMPSDAHWPIESPRSTLMLATKSFNTQDQILAITYWTTKTPSLILKPRESNTYPTARSSLSLSQGTRSYEELTVNKSARQRRG